MQKAVLLTELRGKRQREMHFTRTALFSECYVLGGVRLTDPRISGER
jgi:hypothetical protein